MINSSPLPTYIESNEVIEEDLFILDADIGLKSLRKVGIILAFISLFSFLNDFDFVDSLLKLLSTSMLRCTISFIVLRFLGLRIEPPLPKCFKSDFL